MPIKSPGGYQLIDLKGISITSEQTPLTDPDLLKFLGELYNDPSKRGKPLYITNYECSDLGLYGTPLLMRDEMETNDTLVHIVDATHAIVLNVGATPVHAFIKVENL